MADDAGNERRRHKHRSQDETDGHHRAGDLFHGPERGIARRQSGFNVMFHRFHHDNGIVYDNADGKHQSEQREIVQAKAHARHDREGADNCHGHGDERNQRRPPILQEYQHDQSHQDNGIEQRLSDLGNGFFDERRSVVNDAVVDARREMGPKLPHARFDRVGKFQSIRAGELVNGQRHRRLAVERAGLIVGLGAELDAGDVFQINEGAADAFEDDVLKLFGGFQSAQRGDDVL